MDRHDYEDDAAHDWLTPQPIARRMILTSLWDPYRALGGNRALAHLLAGQGLSSLADWLLAVVLSVLVRDISHSNMAVALLTLARLAPYALVLPWAGLVLDRADRRLLMAGLGLGRATCMLGLLVVLSTATLPLLFLLVFLSSSLSCLLRPTINATIPDLVGERDAVAANGLVTQLDGAAHIVGPVLAAGFLWLHAPHLALIVTASAFALSGASFLTAPKAGRHIDSAIQIDLSPREAMAGFRYLLRENQGVLVALAVIAAGLALLQGAYYVLAVALCKDTFHLGGQGVGWLDAAFGVGGLAASVLVSALARGSRIVRVFVGGAGLSAVGVLFLSVSPPGPLPFACMLVLGMADVMVRVTVTTILQAAAPRDMLGRTFTAFEATLVGATVIGALAAGRLVSMVGPRGATALFGLTCGLLLLVALPRLRSLESILGVRVFLRGVPMLASLSRQDLDELAPRFEFTAVPAGTSIVREGERGRRLYIVKDGEVEVSIGGIVVRTLGRASYFGELALLHDVPRTATVRAITPTTLYSLDGAAFQEVVERARDVKPWLTKRARASYRFTLPLLPD